MRRGLVAKLALLGVSVLLCALAGELAVRLLRPQTLSIWSHTRDGIVIHRSHIRGYETPEGKRIDTNSQGMRDREHPLSPPAGVFRILLLGDSFMEAVQVDWEDTLAARLETRLGELTGRTIEIVNASVSGWGTDDELAYYLRHARQYSPDLILVGMTLHNDVSDNLAMEFHSIERGELVARPPQAAPAWTRARQAVQEWLASHSQLYRLIAARVRAEAVRTGGEQLNRHVSELVRRDTSPQVAAGWAMTLALLDELRGRGAEAGARLAVFLIPLAIQVNPAQLDPFLAAAGLDASELALERPQAIVLEWGGSRGVPVLDLLPDFRAWATAHPGATYLVEDGHWNERGHALAAEAVARKLASTGLIPAAAKAAPESPALAAPAAPR